MKIVMAGGPRWRWRNVPLPEPHLALLVGGLILHRVWPWMLLSAGRSRLVSGWSLIAGGVALVAWATGAAGDIDLERPDRLVASGPYAVSRHPMYTGWSCIYLGVALVVNTCWLIILAPLLLALVHFSALAEERELEKHFGGDYRAYKKRVRRFL